MHDSGKPSARCATCLAFFSRISQASRWNPAREHSQGGSSTEIAAALTLAAEGRYCFTEEEVANASATFGKQGDPISSLFKSRTQYELPKRQCLCNLVDQLQPGDPTTYTLPLVVLIGQILQIASLNHKPTFVDTWLENQESGYLGLPTEGEDKMAANFDALRGIQDHLDR